MTLIRWEPFREVESLQREMNRLFDKLTPFQDGESKDIAFMPAAEMHETENTMELKLEVPGLEAKDIDVRVTEQSVAISGERQSQSKAEEGGMTRTEFRYGKFARVIPLPTRIQNDKVQANYKDGVLSLSLPKAEDEMHKVVKVDLG